MSPPAAELVLTKSPPKPKKTAKAAASAAPKTDELRYALADGVLTTPSGLRLAMDRIDGDACGALTRGYNGTQTLLVDGHVVAEDDCGYNDGFMNLLKVYRAIMP